MKKLINKIEEVKIKAEWEKWNREAHPEDRLSYMDYLGELGIKVKNEDEDWYGEEDDWYK